ncbi:MAG: CBU_0592 family membrane protein [Georgenia sp.]
MSDLVSTAITITGWVGALASVSAYAMVTQGRIAPNSMVFQGLNIGGAAALAVSASANGAWPSAVVNIIWIAIGVQAVLTLKRAAIFARPRARVIRFSERLIRTSGRTHSPGSGPAPTMPSAPDAHLHHPKGSRPGGSTHPSGRTACLTRPVRSRSHAG